MWYEGDMVCALVQAKTFKRMVEVIQTIDSSMSMNYFRNYWFTGMWGNDGDKQLGDTQEEGLWISNNGTRFPRTFKKIK